ncbi:MAG: hypothetical protein KDA41_02265 [Planctomycetales bacterium]|nr:hypothetical protein [Planctomycetales bacterium]
MPESVLEAIKSGIWDFEPSQAERDEFDPTPALPGTQQKLAVLAARLESGLPLWHDSDRLTYADAEED